MAFKPEAENFLIKTLGQDGLEALNKFELYKKKSNTVVDHEEVKTALQIVPRTVISLLQKELSGMSENEGKKFELPFEGAELQVTKYDSDVYSGEISNKGKIIAVFKNRTIPGIGLVIMTTFELYDIDNLDKVKVGEDAITEKKIQDIIDERLSFRSMVSKIVDQKISEREAIEEMIRLKLTQAMNDKPEVKAAKKDLALKKFLEKKGDKLKTFKVQMEKSESVCCPDCGMKIFTEGAFSGCVCLGEDRHRKIFIRKNESELEIKFSRAWDQENIEMILEVLREKNNRRSR